MHKQIPAQNVLDEKNIRTVLCVAIMTKSVQNF